MHVAWLDSARVLLVEFRLRVVVPRGFFTLPFSMSTVVFTVFVDDGAPTAGATHVLTVSVRRLRPLCLLSAPPRPWNLLRPPSPADIVDATGCVATQRDRGKLLRSGIDAS